MKSQEKEFAWWWLKVLESETWVWILDVIPAAEFCLGEIFYFFSQYLSFPTKMQKKLSLPHKAILIFKWHHKFKATGLHAYLCFMHAPHTCLGTADQTSKGRLWLNHYLGFHYIVQEKSVSGHPRTFGLNLSQYSCAGLKELFSVSHLCLWGILPELPLTQIDHHFHPLHHHFQYPWCSEYSLIRANSRVLYIFANFPNVTSSMYHLPLRF